MPKSKTQITKSDEQWLAAFQADLMRRDAAIRKLDRTKVEIDKQARALDVEWAEIYVTNRVALIEVLDKLGIKEQQWCRTLGRGLSYSSVMRRIQILRGHADYLRRRDEVGDNGCYGGEYAAYLARPEKAETSSRPTRPPIVYATSDPDTDHQFLTGEAHVELRKLPPQPAQVCITSPPYWPARRLYDPAQEDGTVLLPTPDTIGFEETWEEYLDHVVRRDFRELKRVLRPDGVVFVVIDDVIANPSSIYDEQTYHSHRAKMKLRSQVGLRTQDTTKMRPKGNWLGLVGLFAAAMMDDGWCHRDTIIWDKGSSGRKESTDSRCRRNFEYILMFTLSASNYWYTQDALRIPLAGGQPYSFNTGYSTPGRHKPGVLRKDGDRDFRVGSNPLGRVADAVWHIPPSGGYGSHSASFPKELVRRALLLTTPPREMLPVATVIDFYGGTGIVSAVAKQLGLKSIYIDPNPIYTEEARQRVQAAERAPDDPGVANDNLAAVTRAGD
jgi:DNA modification methylase